MKGNIKKQWAVYGAVGAIAVIVGGGVVNRVMMGPLKSGGPMSGPFSKTGKFLQTRGTGKVRVKATTALSKNTLPSKSPPAAPAAPAQPGYPGEPFHTSDKWPTEASLVLYCSFETNKEKKNWLEDYSQFDHNLAKDNNFSSQSQTPGSIHTYAAFFDRPNSPALGNATWGWDETVDGVTVCVWVKTKTAVPIDVARYIIIQAETPGGYGRIVRLILQHNPSNTSESKWVYEEGPSPAGPFTQTVANNTIPNNDWHHLAFTKDKTTGNVILYFDGGTDGVTGTATTPLIAMSSVAVGGIPGGAGGYHNGWIDEVRVYQRVLTATEILNGKSADVASQHQ